jgi:hypothetical protein
MTSSADSATIVLTRERKGSRDIFRSYAVVVDDVQVAKVKRGQTLRLPVSGGRHEIYLRIDWCRSPTVGIDASPGEVISLHCAPAGGMTDVSDLVANADRYIILQIVE